MRKRILEQPIDIITFEEALYLVKAALVNPKQFKIITLNSEMIVKASKDFQFQAAINNANLIIPDSIGIVWAMKFLSSNSYGDLKRIPGIDLAEKILAVANELSKKVAIFGGTQEVLETVVNIIKNKYPNIDLQKTFNGFQGEEKDIEIAQEISKAEPDLILVALGSPNQEIWINKYSNLFSKAVMIGIGGSLDVWAGKKSRAPEWLRNAHLEWFYRLLIDPKRFSRVIGSLPQFVWMVLQEKFKSSHQTKQGF